jgi:hypothetical protein
VFKRVLAYFCLVTYNKQEFQFNREAAIAAIRAAAKLEGVNLEPGEFLNDLCECVCILVEEGTAYVFAHRSFQEYFAAYCLAYISPVTFAPLVTNFARRPSDQVVVMLHDMNPEIFRREYLLPAAKQFEEQLQWSRQRRSTMVFYRGIGAAFYISWINIPAAEGGKEKNKKRSRVQISLMPASELLQFIAVIRRILRADAKLTNLTVEREKRDEVSAREIFSALDAGTGATVVVLGDRSSFSFLVGDYTQRHVLSTWCGGTIERDGDARVPPCRHPRANSS